MFGRATSEQAKVSNRSYQGFKSIMEAHHLLKLSPSSPPFITTHLRNPDHSTRSRTIPIVFIAMSSGPPPPGGSRPPKQPVALPMQLKNNSSSRTWVDVAQGKPPQSTPSKSISAQPNPSEPATAVESTKTPSTAHPTAVSSTAGTISHTGATGTTGSSTASSLSGATPAFEPKTTEKIPSPPEPNRFRARGNLLTNHFQVHFGNAQTIYEYSLGIVQVHPAPAGANPTIIRRIRRRVVYLFTQQLMHGAVITLPANAPQPPANPTTASGARAPATGTQAQALDKHGQKGACEAKPATSQQSDGGKSSPPPVLQGTLLASDYHDTLITLTKVPDQHVGAVYRLNYYEDWENGPSNNRMQFRITMTLLPEIDPHQMLQDLANPIQSNVTVGERNNFLRAFNILFSHRANLRTFQDIPRQRVQLTAVTSSKKFFDLFPSNTTPQQPPATAPWQLNAAMDALPGYFLSSRAVINGNLILNVNTMTSAFYHPFTANSSLNGLITALESLPQRPGRREVQAHLKDIRVKTNYLVQHGGAREVCYSITGVPNVGNHWATAADVITRVVDPTTQQRLTVHQYFQRSKSRSPMGNPTLTLYSDYPHAHVVRADRVVSLGRNVTIPAKLLQVLNGSPVKQKTDMVRHAVRMPDVNRRMIVNEGKTLFGFIPITAQNLQQPVCCTPFLVRPLTHQKG